MQRPAGHHRAGRHGWTPQQRELVTDHLPSLLATATVYLDSRRAAEVLVVATLRAAAREAPDEADPLTWLHAHLWARFRAGDGEEPHTPAEPDADQPLPPDGPGTHDHPPTLAQRLAALPPRARAAVHLVDREGLSYAQLARVLATSRPEAAAILHDARRTLVPAVAAAVHPGRDVAAS